MRKGGVSGRVALVQRLGVGGSVLRMTAQGSGAAVEGAEWGRLAWLRHLGTAKSGKEPLGVEAKRQNDRVWRKDPSGT